MEGVQHKVGVAFFILKFIPENMGQFIIWALLIIHMWCSTYIISQQHL